MNYKSRYTRQQVLDAMDRKGFEGRCEACGREGQQWTLPIDEETDHVQGASMVQGFHAGPPPTIETLTFAVLVCTNCGYTRHYILEYLMRGLENHG